VVNGAGAVAAAPFGQLCHHRAPVWFVAASPGGIAWTIFGAVRFAGSDAATEQSLIAAGLSADQAAVMTGLPAWDARLRCPLPQLWLP